MPTPPPGGYQPARPTNALAIAALVCGIVFAPLGIIFGHISLSQIKRTGEQGRGLALTGLILGYAITVLTVLVTAAALVLVLMFSGSLQSVMGLMYPQDNSSWTQTKRPLAYYVLPEFNPPAPPGEDCQYRTTPERVGKPVRPPRGGKVPNNRANPSATMSTNVGEIGLRLDVEKSPCTVNNFESLTRQGYFDATTCHRLSTGEHLGVLRCGDPSGTGHGGPGYRFPNEYPGNQYPPADPIMKSPLMMYPRGTLAMVNDGQGNGSQFVLVFKDSLLPASHTVFGTIDDTGLATLDAIAQAGVAGGGEEGKPAQPVTITAVKTG